jgi:membrane protease YdiL (CAAX protease family)
MSSFIYLVNHIWRLNDGAAVLTYLFVFGIVLAVAVWFTGSLWLAFGIHWGANITFELSTNILKSENQNVSNGPNWILSITWIIMLFFLLLFFRSINSVAKTNHGN